MGGAATSLGSLALAGALVLLLAACGDSDGDAGGGTVATATSTSAAVGGAGSAASSSVPGASTTSLAPAALTEADTVTTSGLGVVTIGATADAAAEAAGTALAPAGEPVGATGCQYVRPQAGPAGVAFMVNDGTIARVDVESGSIATRSGAHIGSTRDEILGLFGDKIQAEPHPSVAGAEMLVFVPVDAGDANRRVVFETGADGVVVRYWTGRLPEVLWYDGCTSAA
jgi:hypothetical protein